MRTDLSRLVKALNAQEPPKHIWQRPYDHNPSHYKALCNLQGAAPSVADLDAYANDILYERSPLQPDLLRFLLPICLNAWHEDLLANGRTEYGGFVHYFWAALSDSRVLQTLNPGECAAVENFMISAILDRIDQEKSLSFSQEKSLPFSSVLASPNKWFRALSSFCVVFPALPQLWKSWWEMTTPGQACAVLQYLSFLLYEDERNPIFSPWTPYSEEPPYLWEVEGHIYERGWREENVSFLQATLTPAYIEDRLRYTARALKYKVQSPVPQRMLNDFSEQETLLTLRLEELPELLSTSPLGNGGWTI